MIFTPIHVGAACLACAIDDVRGFDLIKNFADFGLIFHAYGSGMDIFALLLEEGFQVPSYPAAMAPNEESYRSLIVGVTHIGSSMEGD